MNVIEVTSRTFDRCSADEHLKREGYSFEDTQQILAHAFAAKERVTESELQNAVAAFNREPRIAEKFLW